MEISKGSIVQLVANAQCRVIDCVENEEFQLSSEKTFVFKFMWELAKLVKNEKLKFDFEYPAYEALKEDDRFLDLLVWTDKKYKAAFEFKLPKRGLTGTGSTQVKPKIYRDLARIKYLVDNKIDNINIGFFLCAVNEDSYLNMGRANPTYAVAHNHIATITESYGLPLPNQLAFTWTGIQWDDRQQKTIRNGKFAWLEPIQVS